VEYRITPGAIRAPRGDHLERAMDEIALRAMEEEEAKRDHFHSVLARMVSTVTEDHTQLRTLIYEFARRKLRKDLFRQFEDGDWSEIERRVSTLEAAIDRVETDFSNGAPQLTFQGEQPAIGNDAGRPTTTSTALRPISQREWMTGGYSGRLPSFLASRAYDVPPPPILTVTEQDSPATGVRLRKYLRSNISWTLQLAAAVILGLAIYSAVDNESVLRLLHAHRIGRVADVNSTDASETLQSPALAAKATPRSTVSDIPLPSSYGVYGLSDGKLTALDLFPIKIPDSRVAMSALVTTPSQAHLAAGPLQFVVYRRDLASDSPDRVAIRIVAQVKRALTFGPGGNAAYTKVEQSWVVRSNSYDMSVTPVADNPAMVVIRPQKAEFVLPAGRYALVVKREAYDFTVDGPIRDPAHCLERTDALGAAVYSECPHP
jgi:hypothetical protein